MHGHPSDFWGKLDDASAPVTWHPLRDHCLDVALVLRAIADLPVIEARLNACIESPLRTQDKDRLAVIAFLHDLGKCNWGFQTKCDPHARLTAGHVREVFGLFRSSARPQLWEELCSTMSTWFAGGPDSLEAALFAAFSHHGRPLARTDLDGVSGDPTRWWRVHGDLEPMRGVVGLVEAVRDAFPCAFEHGPAMAWPPRLQHRFAGLLMLADWIGSDTRYFPYRSAPEEDRAQVARDAAARALAEIGLDTTAWKQALARRRPSFVDVFAEPPWPLQRHMAESLPIDDSAHLALIESETGSGKTEAALIWFLRLFAAGAVDGMYFALPTRVAARELYGRVLQCMTTAFPDARCRPSPVLLAVPGYARVNGEQAVLPEPTGRLWPDDTADQRREATWAAERPKRFLAAPIAVGTIDQALLSALQVKHAHLRSACLDRQLLIVDEVHASDPYMRTILAHLLRHHVGCGGWALLLSATLGEVARTELLGPGEPTPMSLAMIRPYPAISTGSIQRAIGARSAANKRVRIDQHEGLEPLDALAPPLIEAARTGARVLVVLNTVNRANSLVRAMEASPGYVPGTLFVVAGTTCPHHGRFARADRERMDAVLSASMGRSSTVAPLVVIGTQTLEQSLDLDADFLVTDPCPMDVLLQRIGRLHRHLRPTRPARFVRPRALMLVPSGRDFSTSISTDGQGRGKAGIGYVYPDLRVLQRTVDELAARGEVDIPRDNRALVELATHPEALARLTGDAWQRHAQYLTGKLISELRAAELSALDEQPFGECQFRAPDEHITTRLGANDHRVQLPSKPLSPFGGRLDELTIPGHLAPKTLDDTACELVERADGFTFAVGGRHYRYSRFGLELAKDGGS